MIEPTSGKNWWTFGGDLVLGMDSRSLFHVSQHYRIWHFRGFISISHIVTSRFSQKSTNDWRRLQSTAFW